MASRTHKTPPRTPITISSFNEYLSQLKLTDILIVNKDGKFTYSANRSLATGVSLLEGPLAAAGPGRAFQKATTNPGQPQLTDLTPQNPPPKDPAIFFSSTIQTNNTQIGVIIFELPISKITQKINEKISPKEKINIYLVGADQLLRSDSMTNENFQNEMKNTYIKEALNGNIDVYKGKNHRDEEVFAAYTHIDLPGGQTWALVAEIDAAELSKGSALLATRGDEANNEGPSNTAPLSSSSRSPSRSPPASSSAATSSRRPAPPSTSHRPSATATSPAPSRSPPAMRSATSSPRSRRHRTTSAPASHRTAATPPSPTPSTTPAPAS
jgi:hypothetical protein